jgi:multidrug efflux pump subunit AcrB
MSRFAIRTPYFILVLALIIVVVGGTALRVFDRAMKARELQNASDNVD